MSYLEHLQNNKTPHQRRQFALQLASIITGLLFIGWISTVGIRFISTGGVEQLQSTAATLIPVGNATTTFGF
jgi:hypothetical protein